MGQETAGKVGPRKTVSVVCVSRGKGTSDLLGLSDPAGRDSLRPRWKGNVCGGKSGPGARAQGRVRPEGPANRVLSWREDHTHRSGTGASGWGEVTVGGV